MVALDTASCLSAAQTWRTPLKTLAYIVPCLVALWAVDNWLTDDRTVGWERNSVRNSLDRWENNTRARHAILGSSTSKDWLPGSYLQTLLKAPRGTVVDAHINGCHQGCTWSEVRRMVQRHRMKRCRFRGEDRCSAPEGPKFKTVFFGTNLFQMCEDGHSKRNLQHSMLVPTEDIPALFGIYAAAQLPLEHMGRFIGMKLSGAYGDTRALRDYWGQSALGDTKSRRDYLWYRRTPSKKAKEPLSCDYLDENVALKLAFSRSLIRDLSRFSEQTFIMLLPDRSVLLDDPVHKARWAKHKLAHQKLADEHPNVHLLDLTGSVTSAADFRDGFHLDRKSYRKQQTVFEREYRRVTASGQGE